MDSIAQYIGLYLDYPGNLWDFAYPDPTGMAIWLGIGVPILLTLIWLKWRVLKKIWIAAWFFPGVATLLGNEVSVPWPLMLWGVPEYGSYATALLCLLLNLAVVFSVAAIWNAIQRARKSGPEVQPRSNS